MRISLMILVCAALTLPANPQSQSTMPFMTSVTPDFGKVGDTLTVSGENLGEDVVSALFLTDETTDVKVPIVSQSGNAIKFKIPPQAKPGRYALMVLTKGKEPRLMEQPVKITIAPETAASPAPPRGDDLRRTLGNGPAWRLDYHVR